MPCRSGQRVPFGDRARRRRTQPRAIQFAVAAVTLLGATGGASAAVAGINLGVIDVVILPDVEHAGLYPYVAASLALTTGRLTVIPSLGVEGSSSGRWGFVAGAVVDVALNDRVGLDGLVSLVHDQAGADWENALFLLGVGIGVSLNIRGLIVSPSVSVFRGLNLSIWAIVPGLNLAAPF